MQSDDHPDRAEWMRSVLAQYQGPLLGYGYRVEFIDLVKKAKSLVGE